VRSLPSRAGLTATLTTLAAALCSCQAGGLAAPGEVTATSPVPSPTDAMTAQVDPESGSAAAALASLPVKGRAPLTGYTRKQFGPAWADVDHNGCDTRDDILRAQLTQVQFRTGTHDCVVVAGVLNDPYTGRTITFVKAKASAVQIDHVVALGNVWQTGGQALSAEKRELLANDPLELLAVNGPTNESKGDGDAATWLPPRTSIRCAYVARQIAVKTKYGLWVTPPEQTAMTRILATCPGQPVPSS
jgi:hypothetical protein